jgi:spore maturation protein B
VPTPVSGVLISVGSRNPTAVFAPTRVATAVAHAAAITTAKLLEKRPWRGAIPAAAVLRQPAEPSADYAAVLHDAEAEAPPMIRGGELILAGVALAFLAMLLVQSFPEWVGRPVTAAESGRLWVWRLLDGVSKLAIPWLVLIFPLYAALRRIPVYEEFVRGAKEGFGVAVRILPYVVGMFLAIGMLRAAGGMDLIGALLRPLTDAVRFPPEVVPMALIRPFSGSAALGVLGDIAHHYPPDSLPVLIAGTLYGCSETTFYVIAVYFGAVSIKKTRHAVPAGIVADIACPLAAVAICTAMFG